MRRMNRTKMWSVKSEISYSNLVKGVMNVRKALTSAQYEASTATDNIEMMLVDSAVQSEEVSAKMDEFNESIQAIKSYVNKAIEASDRAKNILKAVGGTATSGGTGDLMGGLIKDRYAGQSADKPKMTDEEIVKALRWFRRNNGSVYGRSKRLRRG